MPENTGSNGKDLKIIGEDPGVAAFVLMCITTAKKLPVGISITDLIIKTSQRENLLYHLGHYEFGQAKGGLIKAVRFEKAATLFDRDGNPKNAVPKGAYNNLLGKKIFADQDRGTKPSWAGHTNPLAGAKAPSGRDLPIVREFLRYQETMTTIFGYDDYSDEWVDTKIKAAPAIRDIDLQIAIDTMKRGIEALQNIASMKTQIASLHETVTRLTQERHADA